MLHLNRQTARPKKKKMAEIHRQFLGSAELPLMATTAAPRSAEAKGTWYRDPGSPSR